MHKHHDQDAVQAETSAPPKQNAPKPRSQKATAPKPFAKEVDAEIILPDEVNLRNLAKLLNISMEQAESTFTELGLSISSAEDLVAPSEAELVAMAHGKLVSFSKAVQVSTFSFFHPGN